MTSMSENDESSNIEAPSPATPLKSPEKSQDSPLSSVVPPKKEAEAALGGGGSRPTTPHSGPPSPQSLQEVPVPAAAAAAAASPFMPLVDPKAAVVTSAATLVKPGVLRYNSSPDDFGVFPSANKPHVTGKRLDDRKLKTIEGFVEIVDFGKYVIYLVHLCSFLSFLLIKTLKLS